MYKLCDKCRTDVPLQNDAVSLEAAAAAIQRGLVLSDLNQPSIQKEFALNSLVSGARHLLPVKDGDEIVCEGSPSRAQYLEGQPQDLRGATFNNDNEGLFRRAFEVLRTLNDDYSPGKD